MSSVQNLQQFVSDRLAAAAQEIFGVFQQTVSELEGELDRHRMLVRVLLKQPSVRLHRIDVQHLRPSQDCEEPHAPRDTDGNTDHVVQLKSEDVEVLLTSRWTPHIKTEEDGDEWGGSEPARSPVLLPHLKSHSSGSETDDSKDWGKGTDTRVFRSPGGSVTQRALVRRGVWREKKRRTAEDGEHCCGPEPARRSDPLQRSFSSETDDSDDWRETSNTNPDVFQVKVYHHSTYQRLFPSTTKADGPEAAGHGFHLRPLSSEFDDSDDSSVPHNTSPVKRLRSRKVHLSSLVCARCGRSCKSQSKLIQHMKLCATEMLTDRCSKDSGRRDVFFCDQCGSSFGSYNGLQEHMRRERLRRVLLDHQYCRPLAV